ncbi:MAG TPA: NAD(P)/FAD-dependent oxidoreductase [Micromonosporaceae bacterium]
MSEYDVIVVGTRVAGAATAMLLARRGLRVLAVDRASFPSDTLSTHQLQVPGVARLRRWGLLDRLVAQGTPATRRVRFDAGGVTLEGTYPAYDGVDALYSPRRTVLDALLVDAAREAGVEVRERYAVEELLGDDHRVTGIRGARRGASGGRATDTARLVVGADGKRSLVARTVGARAYRSQPARTFAVYGYWSGLEDQGGELYQRPGLAVPAFPTNDGLTMICVLAPLDELTRFRRDPHGRVLEALDACGDLGERARDGVLVERLRFAPDLPQEFRVPHGPGWALVGDAGLVLDPISAMGISHAFRDAEMLTDAVADAHRDGRPLHSGPAAYHRRRDSQSRSMFDFTARLTADLARRRPLPIGQRALLRSLVDRPQEISRFLGVLAGVESPDRYRSARNVARLLLGRAMRTLGAAVAGPELASGSRFARGAAARDALREPHEQHGEHDLDEVSGPVDALRVADTEPVGDDPAEGRRDNADENRHECRDVLPAR